MEAWIEGVVPGCADDSCGRVVEGCGILVGSPSYCDARECLRLGEGSDDCYIFWVA